MKKLRALVIAMAVLTLTSFIAGCGQSGEKKEANNNKDKVVIEYWHINGDSLGGQANDQMIKAFNASQDKIEVVGRFIPDTYKGLMQNLQAEAAAGKAPAIVQVGWAYKEYFGNNFKYIQPEELINKYFPDDKTWFENKFTKPVRTLAMNQKNQQVGLPYGLSTPILYLNLDILQQAGVDPKTLTTWTAIRDASKQIKDNTGKYGLYIAENAYTWEIQQLLESNGTKYIQDGKAAFASTEGIEAYQLMADMILKDKSALHIDGKQGVQSFIQGDVGMHFNTVAYSRMIKDGTKANITAIPAPGWDGKKESYTVPAGGNLLAITAQTEEQQKAAWEFLKYLYQPDNIGIWLNGTGYIPPTADAIENETVKKLVTEDPFIKVAYDSSKYIDSWVAFPGSKGLQAEQILIDLRDKVLGGTVTVSDGLKQAQDEINTLISK